MKTYRSNPMPMTLALAAMLSLSLAPALQATEIGAISFSHLTESDLGGSDIIVYPDGGGAGSFDSDGGPGSFTAKIRAAASKAAADALLSRAAQFSSGGGPADAYFASALTADAASLAEALSERLAKLAQKFIVA